MEPPFTLFNASGTVKNLTVQIGSSKWINASIGVEISFIVFSQMNWPCHEEAPNMFMEFLCMKRLNQFIAMLL